MRTLIALLCAACFAIPCLAATRNVAPKASDPLRGLQPWETNYVMMYSNGIRRDGNKAEPQDQIKSQVSLQMSLLSIPELYLHAAIYYSTEMNWNAFDPSSPMDLLQYSPGVGLAWEPDFFGVGFLGVRYQHTSTGEAGDLSAGWDRFAARAQWESPEWRGYWISGEAEFWWVFNESENVPLGVVNYGESEVGGAYRLTLARDTWRAPITVTQESVKGELVMDLFPEWNSIALFLQIINGQGMEEITQWDTAKLSGGIGLAFWPSQ